MMGLSPEGGAKRYDSVIEFAELERVPGAEAQELLLGHAGPARVLGGDPGRCRHPADRRGARGRRRRVPAEVLRRVPPDARRGQDDRVRDPRHGRDAALLPPRAAARARFDGPHRRPHEVADRYLELNFGRDPNVAAQGRRRACKGTAMHGCSRYGSRTSRAGVWPPRRRARASRCKARVHFLIDVEDPEAGACTCTTRSRGGDDRDDVAPTTRSAVAFRAGEQRGVLVHLRERSGSGAVQPGVHARAIAARGLTSSTVRRWILVRGHRRRPLGGIVDLPYRVGRPLDRRGRSAR